MQLEEYNECWLYPTIAVLNITDDCNLACHYCFVQQRPRYMTLEVAKQSVDYLYNNYLIRKQQLNDEDCYPAINFFGGEPALLWDEIIVPLTNYIRKTYDIFDIGITSNCTLLNEDRINFLIDNNIHILTSIDGDKFTQDLTRPCKNGESSYDLIINNIKYLLKHDDFFHLTMRATLNQENVSQLFHNYLFGEQLGFHQCFFSVNEREKWSEENLLILEQEVTKIFQYHLVLFENNLIPSLNSSLMKDGYINASKIYYAKQTNSLESIKKEHVENYTRCGLGVDHISINFEGKIFGCQEQDSREKTNSFFEIGDIYTGIKKDKLLTLIDYAKNCFKSILVCENPIICDTCKNIMTCKEEFCPSTTFDIFHTFEIKSEVMCRYRNAYTNNALILLYLLQENQTFMDYVKYIIEGRFNYNGYK